MIYDFLNHFFVVDILNIIILFYFKLQECILVTHLMPYKRFQQTYAEKKSPKIKTYSLKPPKKE